MFPKIAKSLSYEVIPNKTLIFIQTFAETVLNQRRNKEIVKKIQLKNTKFNYYYR